MFIYFSAGSLGTMGIYLAGSSLSANTMFNDICNDLLYQDQNRNSTNGVHGGIKEFIGCLQPSFQNIVNDQLMNFVVAEFSLLTLINSQIKDIPTPSGQLLVHTSPSEAILKKDEVEITDQEKRYYVEKYTDLLKITESAKNRMADIPSCRYIATW